MPRIMAGSLEEHHELVWQNLTAAMTRLLSQRDYEAITLGHIATEAGIARSALYNYAPDKTALVAAITVRASQPVLDRVAALGAGPGSATQRLRAIIDELIRAYTSDVLRLMLQTSPFSTAQVAAVRDRSGPFGVVLAAVEHVVADGCACAEFAPVRDVPFTVALLGGIVRAGTERMVLDELSPERVIPAVQDLVLAALTGPRPSPAPSLPGPIPARPQSTGSHRPHPHRLSSRD